MTAPQAIIGLDVGTTNVKAVAFFLDGRASVRTACLQRSVTSRPGRNEQDPMQVLEAVREALRGCVAQLAGVDIVALSVATAMHGLLGIDGAQEPRTPLLTWADRRGTTEAEEWRAGPEGARLQRLTGVPVHPMSPLVKLRWFTRHEPETVAAVQTWLGLKDWVLWWLTGELLTERSSASGTGLLDLHERRWHPEALAAVGITEAQLPPIHRAVDTRPLRPEAASALGLPSGLPVVLGAGDGPAANLGTGAMASGVAALSIGTSGALRVAVPAPVLDDGGALFCYSLTEDTWVLGGAISNGGSVASWAAESLADPGDDEATVRRALLREAADVPAGSDGLVMLPYLLGERAPQWDAGLTGAYLGLRAAHTRGHLVRAAVEGVARQLRLVLDRLDGCVPVTRIRATGGAFGDPLWAEVITATLERPVSLVDHVEGTALGAAALGAVGVGLASDPAAAAAQLCDPRSRSRELPVDPVTVEAYRRERAALPQRLDALASQVRGLAVE